MIRVSISPRIARDIEQRAPDHLPVDKLTPGTAALTVEEVRALLADAQFNSNRRCVDVGPDCMPVATFNAYAALARQIERRLAQLGLREYA